MLEVVVQQLSIHWSKVTRGAPAATRRDALPRALPWIPAFAAYSYRHHAFDEWNDYLQRLVEEDTSDRVPRTCRDLSLTLDGERLSLRIHWTDLMGSPIGARRAS